MQAPTYERFFNYEELTQYLQQAAQEHPNLLKLVSIGKSHQGREIWLLEVTNHTTGAAIDKPAFWVDGNIHSIELTASVACLHWTMTLVNQYGKDRDVTHLLDTRTIYICPRINPDGAQAALAANPHFVRSSMRKYPGYGPFGQEPVDGLDIHDIDGDGRILTMRVPDPNGPWKTHPQDPRVMVRREPTEFGGQYYRVIPEGTLRNYDGINITVNRPDEGLDLNRNFPSGWRQEFEQLGAGDYPTSEPEVKAVVDFFIAHPNIGAGVSIHTFSGVLLRPYSMHSDDTMPPEDLWVYKKVGQMGEQLTGYPAISVFHEFKYRPDSVISGTFDWIYEQMGMFEWTIEVWSPMREAGIEKYDYIDWFREHPEEHDLMLARWSDQKCDGKALVDWKPFDHPQLGKVEIGGWDKFRYISNPGPQFMQREVEKFPAWLQWQAMVLPLLQWREPVKVEALGGDHFKLTATVHNTGWLPTNVTQVAIKRQVSTGIAAELQMPADVKLIAGKQRDNLGELSGWSHKHTGVSFWPDANPTSDIGQAQWIVQAKPGAQVTVMMGSDRGGKLRQSVTLK